MCLLTYIVDNLMEVHAISDDDVFEPEYVEIRVILLEQWDESDQKYRARSINSQHRRRFGRRVRTGYAAVCVRGLS